MKRVSGTFNSTGVALYICLGFVPDWVKIWNLSDADKPRLEWSRHMRRLAATMEGLATYDISDMKTIDLANGEGVAPFDPEFSNVAVPLAAGSTVYLKEDNTDRKDDIRNWVLDTAGSRTGHFTNSAGSAADLDVTYCPDNIAGPEVVIEQNSNGKKIRTYIVALTNDGDADDEVTLADEVTAGKVLRIGGAYMWTGMSQDEVPSQGFMVNANATADINDTTDELHVFEAGTFDVM